MAYLVLERESATDNVDRYVAKIGLSLRMNE